MGILGNSLPGWWRPFLTTSPWNTKIQDARTHPLSNTIMEYMRSKLSHLALGREYCVPIWVIDSERMPKVKVKSERVHDFFREGDYTRPCPVTSAMWQEQTSDGHISIIDPYLQYAWEMSRFVHGTPPQCTTYNEWALNLTGYGDPNQGERWTARGGRASGFPCIAGLLRPEELEAGVVRHALTFTFPDCRKDASGAKIFIHPPACRSDGKLVGEKYPVQGMRFQLQGDENDFDKWGLSEGARVIARALAEYGMFLGDNGGAWKVQPQLLAKNKDEHRAIWDRRVPNIFNAIEEIPTSAFRVVDTGLATVRKG